MKKNLLIALIAAATSATSQVDLVSNLKVCMPFQGNAMDNSGNSNNGTVSGAQLTTDRFNSSNNAYHFNGTSDFISIANFAGIAPTNELTISMWAKSDLTTSNCLFMLSPDNPSDRCVGCAQYSNSGSTLLLWDYGNISSGGRTSHSGVAIDNSGWHHYTFIVSQSGNTKQIYLDGVSVSNASYAQSCTNKNLPLYIGAGTDGGAGGSIRFHGSIDDICIYNRALNASEVSALYNGTNTCFTVGIKELANAANGVFYALPVDQSTFAFTGNAAELGSVEVIALDGKLVRTISKNDLQESGGRLSLSGLNNGLYILKISSDKAVYSQKIILNK